MKHVAQAFLLTFLFVVVFGVRGVSAERSPTICYVPAQYSTIQSAVNAACSEISIAAGTYFENIVIPNDDNLPFDITIRGVRDIRTVIHGDLGSPVIRASRKRLTVRDLTIREGAGGIMFTDSIDSSLQNGSLKIINAIIEDSVGSGISASQLPDTRGESATNIPLTITNSTIRGNVGSNGGGISIDGSWSNLVNIRNVRMEFNSARFGGAIFASQAQLNISSVTIDNNSADICGGGIYTDRTADFQPFVYIGDASISSNQAGSGGALCGDSNFVFNTDARWSVSMSGNTAQYDGGAAFLTGGYFGARNLFLENNAAAAGGAIHAGNIETTFIRLINSTLRDNAAFDGGAIWVRKGTVETVTNVNFSENSADSRGGAIYAIGSDINLNGGNLLNNVAGTVGGAVAITGGSAELVIVRSVIGHNIAQDDGGGIHINQSSATFDDVAFRGNTATDGDGGAIYSTGNVTILDTAISDNSALLGGGVAFNQGRFTVDRVSFENNTATFYGGGVFVNFPSPLSSIEDFNISANIAQNGGGIFVYSEDVPNLPQPRLNIARGLIAENTATGSGGGIDGNVNLTQSAVISNTATDSGGGVRTNDSRFINVTISNNSAGFAGSGLVADGLLASYTTIANNFGSAAIFNPTDGPIPVQFEHTIISNPATQNCAGESVQAIGVNTIDSDGSCNFYNSRNLNGVDPLLAPLAMNGGNTPTHALQDGSPAIGSGYDCPDTDQRGGGGPAGNCDLGAYQTNASVPTAIALSTQQTQTMFGAYSMILFVLLAVGTLYGSRTKFLRGT